MLVSPTGFNMFQHFCGCLLQSRKVDLLLANSCSCVVGLSNTSEAVRKLRKQYRRFVFRLTCACSWQGVHESCAPQLDLDSTCLKSKTNFFRGKLQSFTKGTNKANSRGEI